MSRLIDADKLLQCTFKNPISYNALCALVNRQEVLEERRNAHWIDTLGETFGGVKIYQCSWCGAKVISGTENYCYKCGAKMDEVVE